MDSKTITGIGIGLIVGLLLGFFIGFIFISPSSIVPSKTGAGTNNQVQVSGSIQEQNPSEISFSSIHGSRQAVQTSDLITNGQYSVVLVGNQSYSVTVDYTVSYSGSYSETESNSYSLFVPSGVTTFTANF